MHCSKTTSLFDHVFGAAIRTLMQKDRLAAVSPKPNRMCGSGGCALGFFDLEVASDSIEHGHLSLLDRCDGIVDGERSVFVQQVGIISSALNAQIVLPLGYFRL